MKVLTLTIRCVIGILNLFNNVNEINQKPYTCVDTIVIQCS